jgi:hypothetical protein
MMGKEMKLDEALKLARDQLQNTPVPEQDAAVARAHMLAAYVRGQARAQTATASELNVAPASARHQFAGSLAQAGRGQIGKPHPLSSRFSGNPVKWLMSLAILILAGIWLCTPINNSAIDSGLAGVSTKTGQDFMPLVDNTTWAQTQHAVVVPAELALAELAALGLPFDASRAADTVHAELLMSDSGVLIGVRLLQQHETPRPHPNTANDNELS